MLGTRVILADDHTLIVDALRKLLEPEFEVVGTFGDGRSLVEAAPKLKPEVIVLDISMPIMNGWIAAQLLKRSMPGAKLIFLTMNGDQDVAAEALRLGARGYLLKNSAASELVDAIRQVARGGYYVTRLMTVDLVGSHPSHFKNLKCTNHLTIRQEEVLQLLVEGHSMKEVAFMLNVSPRTVAYHKYIMMERLQIKSSAELVHYAINRQVLAA